MIQVKWDRVDFRQFSSMNTPDDEPCSVDQRRSAEARKIIEDYLKNLREIIRKLRGKLN